MMRDWLSSLSFRCQKRFRVVIPVIGLLLLFSFIPGTSGSQAGEGSASEPQLGPPAMAPALPGPGPASDPGAVPDSRPWVYTWGATSITTNSGVLWGVVNPNGADTYAYFQAGYDTSYGFDSSLIHIGSGTSDVYIYSSFSGLWPDTTYHYRVVAYNANGYSYGLDQAATTEAECFCSEEESAEGSGGGGSGGGCFVNVLVKE